MSEFENDRNGLDIDVILLKSVEEKPRGLSSSEIGKILENAELIDLSDRTIRRHLGKLSKMGRVDARGERRGRRYFAVARLPIHKKIDALTPEEDVGYPPISEASQNAIQMIRTPRAEREPVGYKPDFLLNYQPGVTELLTSNHRDKLRALGETPDLDEAAGTFAREIGARLLIDLSWASSQLPENTYSLLDTQRLLEHGHAAEGKDAEETQIILNHKRAIELLAENAGE